MLARVLAQEADLLLLDEPLNHLDLETQELMFHTLEKLSKGGKTSIISTPRPRCTHRTFQPRPFSGQGRLLPMARWRTVMTPETIARAYGFEFHKDYHRA